MGGGCKERLDDTYPQSPPALETHGSPCWMPPEYQTKKRERGGFAGTPSLDLCPLYRCPHRMTSFNVLPSPLPACLYFAPPSDLPDSSLAFHFFPFPPCSPTESMSRLPKLFCVIHGGSRFPSHSLVVEWDTVAYYKGVGCLYRVS